MSVSVVEQTWPIDGGTVTVTVRTGRPLTEPELAGLVFVMQAVEQWVDDIEPDTAEHIGGER